MKTRQKTGPKRRQSALTVIEMSLTLGLLLALAGIVIYSTSGISDWKLGRDASLELQRTYLAQKSYLADHPTEAIALVSESDLIPYLQGLTSIPQVETLGGGMMNIVITQMPPIVGSPGTPYDPSESNEDGLWDVGKH